MLHDLNHACRYADHIIAMRDGKIVAEGKPVEIITAELVERVFGMPCMIIDDPLSHTPLVIPRGRYHCDALRHEKAGLTRPFRYLSSDTCLKMCLPNGSIS